MAGLPNSLVTTEPHGAVLRLTIDNPPANALSATVMEELLAALEQAADDKAIRVIVIAAAGKLFSAGHDLKEMTAHRSDADHGRAYFEEVFGLCSRLMQTIVTHPNPVIAQVDGIATAAGCQLVASCDLAIASDRSRFGVNGIDVGLFCSTPAVALTRTISRKRAMEMLLTGEMIQAATALESGLVNRVVPAAELARTVEEIAAAIAVKSPTAVKIGKQAVREQADMDLAPAYERASSAMVENMLEPDSNEGISAFLEKREPKWQL
jgi:enoyl-CoA hydratase/carnithine racemase